LRLCVKLLSLQYSDRKMETCEQVRKNYARENQRKGIIYD